MNMLAPWVWKVLAGALLISLTFGGWQWVRAGRAQASVKTVAADRDLIKGTLAQTQLARTAAETTANQWQEIFQTQSEAWKKERAELDRIAGESNAARIRADAQAREADAVLNAWLDRYAKAAREPACAAFLATKLKTCRGIAP